MKFVLTEAIEEASALDCINAIKNNKLNYEEDIEAYSAGNSDYGFYVQFQDRETHTSSLNDRSPRVSSNTWLRIWYDKDLIYNTEAPKYEARKKAIIFLSKYLDDTDLVDLDIDNIIEG